MKRPSHIGIIEDDDQIRQLMQLLLNGTPGYTCNQAYNSVEKGVPALLDQAVDLLLMDIDLPGKSGIEGVTWLKEKGFSPPIIMLTVHEDQDAVFDSLCAGAIGYLVKGTPPVQLLAAIEEAIAGGSPMSPSIARQVVRSFHRSGPSPLSDREQEVLKLLAQGENYRTIGEQLFISKNTVKTHIKNIYEKLQVKTRAEAIGKALNDRLL